MQIKAVGYFLSLTGLGTLIGGGNWLAINFDLYFLISWLDSLMHTLSGIFIALALFPFLPQKVRPSRVLYVVVLVVTFIIGLLWEYVELRTGVTSILRDGFWADTEMDLVCDVLGALLGVFFIRSHLFSSKSA